MIEIQNITFAYPKQKRPIFSDFSLTIPSQVRRYLWGENGLGKTTLLRLILGLEKPQQGKIISDETGFAVVFQEDRLIPTETILSNVALFSDNEKATEILTALGLADVLNEKPETLSGGMKRRVALARALAHPASALILDEPMTGLDEKTAQMTLQVIDRYAAGRTLIIVTHNAKEAESLNAEPVSFSVSTS